MINFQKFLFIFLNKPIYRVNTVFGGENMENTAQTIVSDTLHLKNRLSIIFLFVTMVLGTGVTYLIGQTKLVILTILIGSLITLLLVTTLVYLRKLSNVVPYILISGIAMIIGTILILATTSGQTAALIYFY